MAKQTGAELWDLGRLEELWAARGLDRRDLMKLVVQARDYRPHHPRYHRPAELWPRTPVSQVSLEWTEPRHWDRSSATAGSEQQVGRLILGALVKMSDHPRAAAGPCGIDRRFRRCNGLHLHLHQNATFNDGTPLTSADVVFTIERAVDTRTASFWQGRFLRLAGAAEYADQAAETIEGLKRRTNYTVVLTLASPNAAFLTTLADFTGLGILPKHILGEVAPENLINDPFNLAPTVGAGPYNFVTYESDQYLEMEANPTFWGDAPAIERIFMRILLPDIAVAELESGTVDLISVSLDDMDRLSENPELTIISIESPSLDSISVNLDREYFQDVRVRQALQYAIDRENITSQLYMGQAIVRNSPIFGPEWMGVPEGLNEYPFDPDQARHLLTDAGWDTNLEVEMMYGAGATSTFQNMVRNHPAAVGRYRVQGQPAPARFRRAGPQAGHRAGLRPVHRWWWRVWRRAEHQRHATTTATTSRRVAPTTCAMPTPRSTSSTSRARP